VNIVDIEVVKGNDQSFTLAFVDESGPIDITGWEITFSARSRSTGTTLTKVVTAHTDQQGGISRVALSNTDTTIASGKYTYSIIARTNVGEVFTALGGAMLVLEY
jgi:hypothetical protein